MTWSYSELRGRLMVAEWWPRGRVARVAWYLLGLGVFLFLLRGIFALVAPSWGASLAGWAEFLASCSGLLFLFLAFGLLRRKILWRLRNRLIVTYVFIGVIPAVLLVALAFITLYLFAGQFAVFIVTSEIHSQLRSLEAVNAAVSNELAARLERGESPAAESLAGLRKRDPAWGRRQVCAWYRDQPLPLCAESKSASLKLPSQTKGEFQEIVRDHGGLHLRVVSALDLNSSGQGSDKSGSKKSGSNESGWKKSDSDKSGSDKSGSDKSGSNKASSENYNRLVVVTSEPFDKELMGAIAANLGEITLSATADNEPTRAATPAQTNSGQQSSGSPGGTKTDPLQSGSAPSGSPQSGSAKSSPAQASLQPTAGGAQAAAPQKKKSFVYNNGQQGASIQVDQQPLHQNFTVGALPAAAGSLDREVAFFTPLSVVDWNSGDRARAGAVVQVRTRPSVLYGHLFAALGEFVQGVEYILIAVAIIFAVIELIALIIGTRMTRTVTRAVAQLYEATKHVDRGDFSHRIPVKSRDQLAELSLSFNSMTASIEKLILEQKEKQRLENELAIAQEVQAQLFPRQVSELESLEVHGFCRPARTVSGDYYDFLTASSHKLILAVGDISGKGISAALLMATIHSAVRAYSVESLPQMREPVAVGAVAGSGRIMATYPEGVEVSPGALLGLLNHQLYESTPPEKYATLFLGIYDGRNHCLTYSNGGHLPPILIARNGSIRRLEAGGTVVGLFDNMSYEEGSVEMKPDEIFLAYSDGVTEPENEFGEFGEQRLIDLVSDNRSLDLPQISQMVTRAVDNWIGDNEQPDDVTLVLARAR